MGVQMTLQGTIRADGSLELDDPVAMPEGRVLVTVRPVVQPESNDPFWPRMEQVWAGQRARGHVPRTKEQIDAELRELRDDAEDEMRATERLHDECRRAPTRRARARGADILMVFLDASIVIYFVEQPFEWGSKASAHLADLRAAGETFAATELVRMECLVGPIKTSDAAAMADFMAFFAAPDVAVLPITRCRPAPR